MSKRILTSITSLTLLCACGGDADPTESVDGGGAVASDAGELTQVTVNVSYEGDREGDLVIGAFLSDPPTGPPLAFRTTESPVFPAAVELRDLEPNTYYITAVLDAEPASPTLPGPEDLTVTSDPLVVEGDASHTVSLTLTDP